MKQFFLKTSKRLKFLLLLTGLVVSGSMNAQNLQFHYDLGHVIESDRLSTRPSVTTTFEMFKPDKWGSTFLFCDLDYYTRGVAGAYWEISREFSFGPKRQWAAHVEYDGGASTAENLAFCNRFQQAALVGPAWNWHSADFSSTFSVQTMYKHYFKGQRNEKAFSSFQLTTVWGTSFFKGLCTFSGFFDVWHDPHVNGKWIVLSEPQLWFNLNKVKACQELPLSIGTELEVSNNFVHDDYNANNRLYVIPTLALKWSF